MFRPILICTRKIDKTRQTENRTSLGGKSRKGVSMRWRPGPELNRCTRFCKPLHNHSATGPPQGTCVWYTMMPVTSIICVYWLHGLSVSILVFSYGTITLVFWPPGNAEKQNGKHRVAKKVRKNFQSNFQGVVRWAVFADIIVNGAVHQMTRR